MSVARRLWVRSPLEGMNYNLAPNQKPGVEFHHFTHNSQESEDGSVLTLGSICLPCCVRDTELKHFFSYTLTRIFQNRQGVHIETFYWALTP